MNTVVIFIMVFYVMVFEGVKAKRSVFRDTEDVCVD